MKRFLAICTVVTLITAIVPSVSLAAEPADIFLNSEIYDFEEGSVGENYMLDNFIIGSDPTHSLTYYDTEDPVFGMGLRMWASEKSQSNMPHFDWKLKNPISVTGETDAGNANRFAEIEMDIETVDFYKKGSSVRYLDIGLNKLNDGGIFQNSNISLKRDRDTSAGTLEGMVNYSSADKITLEDGKNINLKFVFQLTDENGVYFKGAKLHHLFVDGVDCVSEPLVLAQKYSSRNQLDCISIGMNWYNKEYPAGINIKRVISVEYLKDNLGDDEPRLADKLSFRDTLRDISNDMTYLLPAEKERVQSDIDAAFEILNNIAVSQSDVDESENMLNDSVRTYIESCKEKGIIRQPLLDAYNAVDAAAKKAQDFRAYAAENIDPILDGTVVDYDAATIERIVAGMQAVDLSEEVVKLRELVNGISDPRIEAAAGTLLPEAKKILDTDNSDSFTEEELRDILTGLTAIIERYEALGSIEELLGSVDPRVLALEAYAETVDVCKAIVDGTNTDFTTEDVVNLANVLASAKTLSDKLLAIEGIIAGLTQEESEKAKNTVADFNAITAGQFTLAQLEDIEIALLTIKGVYGIQAMTTYDFEDGKTPEELGITKNVAAYVSEIVPAGNNEYRGNYQLHVFDTMYDSGQAADSKDSIAGSWFIPFGDTWRTNGTGDANTYAELEFDITSDAAVAAQNDRLRFMRMYLCDADGKNATNAVFLNKEGAMGLSATDLSEKLTTNLCAVPYTSYDGRDMRIRFVFRLTDENGNTYGGAKIEEIWVDGVKMTPLSPEYILTAGTDIGGFRFGLDSRNKASEGGFYLDNLTAVRYTKVDSQDAAPYVSKDRLIGNIAAAEARLEDGNYSPEEKAGITAKLENAKNTAIDTNAANEEISEQTQIVLLCCERLDALAEMAAAGVSEYVNAAAYSSDSLIGKSKLTVNSDVFVDYSSDKEAYAMALLYKKDDMVSGGKLLEMSCTKAHIPAGDSARLTNTIDLGGYTEDEKADMWVKVAVFKATSAAPIDTLSLMYNGYECVIGAENESLQDVTRTLSAGAAIWAEYISDDGTAVQRVNIGIKGEAGSEAVVAILKDGLDFSDMSGMDGNAEDIIKYINVINTDGNGEAVLSYINDGEGSEFKYVVGGNAVSPAIRSSFTVYSVADTQEAINEILAKKDAATLERYKGELLVDGAIYQKASENSNINITETVKNVLTDIPQLTIYNVGDFGSKLLNKLDLVCAVNGAASTDDILKALNKYENEISNASDMLGLSNSGPYNAAVNLYENRKTVTDIASLEAAIANAIAYANKQGSGTSQGGGTGNRGGGGGNNNSGNVGGFVTNGPAQPSETIAMKSTSFSDLAGVEWAKEAIAAFAAMEVINGKSEGIFAPGDIITREEFVKMTVLAFNMNNPEAVCNFTDAARDSWYYPYIASAVQNGIVVGMDDGTFGVGQPVTREDMALIICRILRAEEAVNDDGMYIEFSDEDFIADYAKDAVKELAKSGVVNGNEKEQFMPKAFATRAEAAKMLYEGYKRCR